MGYRYRLKPNFFLTLAVVFILVGCWWSKLLNIWTALAILVSYLIVGMIVMHRNPKIRKEAEEFARQVALISQHKEAELIKNTLFNSVEIRRKKG